MGKRGLFLVGLVGLVFVVALGFALSKRSEVVPPSERKGPAKVQAPEPETTDNTELLARIADLESRMERVELRFDRLKRDQQKPAAKESPPKPEAEAKGESAKKLGLPEGTWGKLEPLLTAWKEEDALRPPDETTWRVRESQLQGAVTEEERVRMHEALVKRAQETWSYMGAKLGSMSDLPAGQWSRLQASLGDLEVPPYALIDRAHGLDWRGLAERALALVGNQLTPQQIERVQRTLDNLK